MSRKGPKISNLQTIIHMNMAKNYMLKESGKIVWPNNPIDGMTIYREIVTRKRYDSPIGKGKIYFYLEGKGTPIFSDNKKFIHYYRNGIPELKPKS